MIRDKTNTITSRSDENAGFVPAGWVYLFGFLSISASFFDVENLRTCVTNVVSLTSSGDG